MTASAEKQESLEIAMLKRDVDGVKNEMRSAVAAIKEATQEISKAFQILVELQTKHEEGNRALERAFKEIESDRKKDEKRDDQISALKLEMPTLKLVKSWVIGGVIGILAMFGVALVALVIKTP